MTLCRCKMKRRIKPPKSRVFSETRVTVQEHLGLHKVTVSRRRHQSLTGSGASKRITHFLCLWTKERKVNVTLTNPTNEQRSNIFTQCLRLRRWWWWRGTVVGILTSLIVMWVLLLLANSWWFVCFVWNEEKMFIYYIVL